MLKPNIQDRKWRRLGKILLTDSMVSSRAVFRVFRDKLRVACGTVEDEECPDEKNDCRVHDDGRNKQFGWYVWRQIVEDGNENEKLSIGEGFGFTASAAMVVVVDQNGRSLTRALATQGSDVRGELSSESAGHLEIGR
jgi:hypothetical protein